MQEKSGQHFTFSVNTKKSLRRKERENYNLLFVFYYCYYYYHMVFCMCCMLHFVRGEWGANPLSFPRLELGQNSYGQESVHCEYGQVFF